MRQQEQKTRQQKRMLRGSLVTGIGTLLSRFLGMLRDAATAAMLGMSSGGVMDAFVFAFRLPEVARRMFGEGSFSTSFIPVFAKLWNEDRTRAWQLFTVALCRIFLILTAFVLFGELACWLGLMLFEPTSKVYLAAHLMSVMLPYLILISLAAICAATLQTLGYFAIVSAIPMVLNIIWLAGILVVAPMLSDDPAGRCYLLALCVLLAGFAQFLIQIPVLRRLGGRFDFNGKAVAPEMRTMLRNMLPTMLGLMSVQLDILAASILAWIFSGPPGVPIRWLGRIVEYPLHAGSVAAIYYSERLFEFPQGLIGMAIATAIYPLISRHAAKKDFQAISDDLGLAVRLQFALGIPAGIGLILFRIPLAHLLYQRGAFTPTDTFRTADMIFWFGFAVWAICTIPVMVRGFYAVGDVRTPLRIAIGCGFLNLLLCLALIWPLQEEGIAIGIAFSAMVQATLLINRYSKKHGLLRFRDIASRVVAALVSSLFMAVAVALTMKAIPGNDSIADILHIVGGGTVGLCVYLVLYRIFGGREIGIFFRGKERERFKRFSPKRRRKRK
ncbi:MAG TPA: murein biosynthesis integral membrane protein MurJ [Planctomycetaceae bacterium]|nr:murein biosynthesis integral membrane protein MurJ [Planctomycetaceae bacterium]